jgi:RNA polymerase primary sigma factor
LYDALLDDFEDDATTADEEETFAKLEVDDVEDLELEDEEPAEGEEGESESGALAEDDDDDTLLSAEETESWSDDPVRMYLTQMGEIPLLTRQEEIRLAKKIEVTRRRFRAKLLECDYVIQNAFKVLKRVHAGELPFDRTVQVSVTDRLEKDQIQGRLPHNLRTLEVLLKRNRRDYLIALGRSQSKNNRKQAWQRLARRRRRSVRLVEELGLRTQRIEPMIKPLEEFNRLPPAEQVKRLVASGTIDSGSAKSAGRARRPIDARAHTTGQGPDGPVPLPSARGRIDAPERAKRPVSAALWVDAGRALAGGCERAVGP